MTNPAPDVKPTQVPNPEKQDNRCYIVYTDSEGESHRILRSSYQKKEADGTL